MPDAESLYKLAGLYNISVDDLMHLTLQIDRDVSYDAPTPTSSSSELSEYLEFYNNPANRKKYMFTSTLEKEFLFYFPSLFSSFRNCGFAPVFQKAVTSFFS